jgi:hypothetical protein
VHAVFVQEIILQFRNWHIWHLALHTQYSVLHGLRGWLVQCSCRPGHSVVRMFRRQSVQDVPRRQVRRDGWPDLVQDLPGWQVHDVLAGFYTCVWKWLLPFFWKDSVLHGVPGWLVQ